MGYAARAAALLVMAVSLFFVARMALGPSYLGLFEPDRSHNIEEWASKPLQYLETEECASCHGERLVTLRNASHQSLICESCHGPATEHVSSGNSLAVEHPEELCIRCHAKLSSRPVSQPQVVVEEHAGDLTCTACHNPHSPSLAGPPNVPHSLEGRAECTICHGTTGVKPFPQDHAGRTKDTCLMCHESPEAPTKPSGPPIVPHPLEGRSECTLCHGVGGIKPFPDDHTGRTSEICLACHRTIDTFLASPTPTAPAGETPEPSGPPQIPHSLEGRSECTICHGVGGFKPFPDDHAGRTSDTCLACHQQKQQ